MRSGKRTLLQMHRLSRLSPVPRIDSLPARWQGRRKWTRRARQLPCQRVAAERNDEKPKAGWLRLAWRWWVLPTTDPEQGSSSATAQKPARWLRTWRWSAAAPVRLLDWGVAIMERAAVISLACAVVYVAYSIWKGVPEATTLIEKVNSNYKILLVLLVPLFYRPVRNFLEDLEEGPGFRRRSKLPVNQIVGPAPSSPTATQPSPAGTGQVTSAAPAVGSTSGPP